MTLSGGPGASVALGPPLQMPPMYPLDVTPLVVSKVF